MALASGTPDFHDAVEKLRLLENNALDSVVRAFRAQGPLTLYKEILLDHLRSALFVSQSDFAASGERAMLDEELQGICQCLNPSYNSFHSWAKAAAPIFPEDFSLHLKRLPESITDFSKKSIDDPTKVRRFYDKHCREEKVAAAKLVTLPKQLFVPERLRQVLMATETSPRLDLNSKHTQTCDDQIPSTSNSIPVMDNVERNSMNSEESASTSLKRPRMSPEGFEDLEPFDKFIKRELRIPDLPRIPTDTPGEVYRDYRPAVRPLHRSGSRTMDLNGKGRPQKINYDGFVQGFHKEVPFKTKAEVEGLNALIYLKTVLGLNNKKKVDEKVTEETNGMEEEYQEEDGEEEEQETNNEEDERDKSPPEALERLPDELEEEVEEEYELTDGMEAQFDQSDEDDSQHFTQQGAGAHYLLERVQEMEELEIEVDEVKNGLSEEFERCLEEKMVPSTSCTEAEGKYDSHDEDQEARYDLVPEYDGEVEIFDEKEEKMNVEENEIGKPLELMVQREDEEEESHFDRESPPKLEKMDGIGENWVPDDGKCNGNGDTNSTDDLSQSYAYHGLESASHSQDSSEISSEKMKNCKRRQSEPIDKERMSKTTSSTHKRPKIRWKFGSIGSISNKMSIENQSNGKITEKEDVRNGFSRQIDRKIEDLDVNEVKNTVIGMVDRVSTCNGHGEDNGIEDFASSSTAMSTEAIQ
ncbi:unnamed protein product [Bursaphelenchus xylophilus]|uniref:(pine wood nematode) hypothetical protein n=1 Tax=Bursaphelenchus xylophilus TaxID=6326 RepID=A0A1I7S0K4_BURXY|nr:unnamed protein product [Bursaphelenchus xylophilus]CAG9132308.1 unnamed protein product [Bursaphelenchus xylophilus]